MYFIVCDGENLERADRDRATRLLMRELRKMNVAIRLIQAVVRQMLAKMAAARLIHKLQCANFWQKTEDMSSV